MASPTSCWEGAQSLVKLNHWNQDLNNYLADVIRGWVREFDIDGLRLDVAYCLDQGYLRSLRGLADEIGRERGEKFPLVGETMFGDYNQWMGDDLCDSVTNYEAYKGLWSSMNAANMHEIAYALERQSGSHPWDLYTGRHMLDFVDNHDVPRIATSWTIRTSWSRSTGCSLPCPACPRSTTAVSGVSRASSFPATMSCALRSTRRSGTSSRTGLPRWRRRAPGVRRSCGAIIRSSSVSRSSWSSSAAVTASA